MPVPTPKQQVQKRFGTKDDLVKEILPLVGGDDETRRVLMGTTNKKLLRIYDSSKQVKDQFGGKAGLIDALATLIFDGRQPNAGWREKMEKKTPKRLLDDYRQYGGKVRRATSA